MRTYYLGHEEVQAYSRDLITRLKTLGTNAPKQWFALGRSGVKVLKALRPNISADDLDDLELAKVNYRRQGDLITFNNSLKTIELGDRPVLVLDSTINSGKTMLALLETLQAQGAKSIISYSLVLKQGAAVVPTFFGLVVGERDRVFLPFDRLPNNRLDIDPPFGILRELNESDLGRKIADIGGPFTHLSVGDLLYEQQAKKLAAYVYLCGGEIAGFITFGRQGTTLFIDALATMPEFRGRHICPGLLRWAETWASARLCDRIEMWAYEGAISVYLKAGFEFADDRWRDLGGERYRIMRKSIPYHVRMEHDQTH